MTAEARSVVVRLSFEAARAVAEAKAAGKAIEEAFGGIDGRVKATDARMLDLASSTHDVGRSVDRTTTDLRSMSRELDTVSGRLGLVAEAGILLGPALSPIGAVGAAGLVSLTAEAGFAAGAAGTLVLGFQGVGDTLEAVNAAALEPTAANLAAARSQMQALDPAAQSLALRLFELKDVGTGLRDTAAAGVLPGVAGLLDSVETRVPTATRLIDTFATSTGRAIARAGDSLAGSRYEDFFDYLDRQAPQSIAATSAVLGNLASAGTEVFEAFEPLQDDVLDALVRSTERLDAAASGLTGSDGMAAFIDYVRTTGPQVADTVGAIGGALAEIATAAAPLGGPVLEGLETVADLVAAVAGSDLGTPFIAGTAAVLAYQRAVTIAQSAQRRLLGASAASGTGAAGGRGLGATLGVDDLRRSLPTLQQAGTYVYRLGQATEQATPRTLAAREAVRGFARELAGSNLAKGAAGIAALTVATSGAADGLGLSNTAALGLAGTMAGPLGAAAGIVAGGLLDIRSTADGVDDAIRNLDRVFGASASTVDDYAVQLAAARETIAATRDDLYDVTGIGDFFGDALAATNLQASGLFGDNFLEQAQGDVRKRQDDLRGLASSLYEVNTQLGGAPVAAGVAADGLSNTYENLDAMGQIADQVAPALDVLGLSVADLGRDPDNIRDVVAAMRELDSSDGRIAAVAASVADLDNQLLSTADSATAFSAALDGLLSPGLNLSAATDQLRGGLRDLTGELDASNRSLVGNTAAADQNRAAIRQQVSNISDYLGAQAAAGTSSDQLARSLQRQRGALVNAAEAAGLSKREVRDYINTLGLTPETVTTLVKANTDSALAALNAIRAYRIPDKSFTVTQYTNARLGDAKVTGTSKGPQITPAAGITVPGARFPYRDSVHALLAPTEEVVSNDRGQADRYRPALKAINANLAPAQVAAFLAAGGTAGDPDDDRTPTQQRAANRRARAKVRARQRARTALGDLTIDIRLDAEGNSNARSSFDDRVGRVRDLLGDAGLRLSKAQKEQIEALGRATREYDVMTDAVRATREAQAQFAAGIAAGLQNDPFGKGLAGFDLQVAADTNDATAFGQALQQAVALGLDGPLRDALAESLDVTTARQLVATGPAGIAAREAAFAGRTAAANVPATFAAQEKYGAQVAAQSRDVREQTRAVRDMQRDIRSMKNEIRSGVRDGARDGSREGTRDGFGRQNQQRQQDTGARTQTESRGGRSGGGGRGRRGRGGRG